MIKIKGTYVGNLCIFFYFWNFVEYFLKFWLFFEFFEFCCFFLNSEISLRCHPSVLSYHALGTVDCDESYCNERGDHIWSSGCGELFYHQSYCDESVIRTIYGFQICCDVSSGVQGYALIWHMCGAYPYMATPQRHRFLGCI